MCTGRSEENYARRRQIPSQRTWYFLFTFNFSLIYSGAFLGKKKLKKQTRGVLLFMLGGCFCKITLAPLIQISDHRPQ